MSLLSGSSIEKLMAYAKHFDALYICPKEDGKRVGPLVPYAGKSADGKNLVGDIYFNFRRIERHPQLVTEFAQVISIKLRLMAHLDEFDVICGIPNGGRSLGQEVARITGKEFVYPEKKTVPTPLGKKQEYEWDLSQFELKPGEKVAVVEDVFNNFQNTDATLEQIARTGAEVVVLVGALNRSPAVDNYYVPKSGPLKDTALSVVVAIRQAYPEYEQIDPEVAADIAAGNLEMDVKKNWKRLMKLSA